MKKTRRRIATWMLGAAMMWCGAALVPKAAHSASGAPITLYSDVRTGQVYTRPGKHRVKLGTYVPAESAEQIEQRVEQKTRAQMGMERQRMRSDLEAKQARQSEWNAKMAKQVSAMEPAWKEFGSRWYKKISLGTLVYGDWGYFTHTGFGPQFLTQQNWPGPGNNSFNSFNITRAYLDFKFTPNDDFLLRVTPNIYAQYGTAAADKVGVSTAYASSIDQNLTYRLKYAYVDYNTFFKKVLRIEPLRDDKITFGQQQNPLVDWEENLWGFRYTALTPWNSLSLSSAQVGLSLKGPIKFHETQYADYDFGVYDDGSFHNVEQSSYKQVMGRVAINPLGAKSRYDSLGISAFYDYGWPNKAPDGQVPGSAAAYAHIMRFAGFLYYNSNDRDFDGLFKGLKWGLIGEADYGQNAFSSGNLYSGSGPADVISGTTTPFHAWNTMAGKLLGTGQTTQLGWDVLGHVDIPNTPFTVFGLWQSFMPNLQPSEDPLDYHRYDLGIQYLIDKNLRIALTGQGIDYYHSQFTFPATMLGSTSVPATANAVPRDTHAFFLNFQFSY
ncbi:MAG: hypothetical protein ACREQI_09420 [Candidatus Binataceae bacterium]